MAGCFSALCGMASSHVSTFLDMSKNNKQKTQWAGKSNFDPPQADVRMFSGCHDSQTSADAFDEASAKYGGACTNSMLYVLNGCGGMITYAGLLDGMRRNLASNGYDQIPQLSYCHSDLDFSEKFDIASGGGRKKALMIGINYVGQQGELNGCHNDVIKMTSYIQGQGFNDVKTLMDDDRNAPPTRENITAGIQWLVAGAQPGDCLFMHYSGHGGSIRDTSGDERDGMDETMCPVDYSEEGCIVDDEIYARLVDPLPAGVRMTVVMDCCHSGTIIDLPYNFEANESNMNSIFKALGPAATALAGGLAMAALAAGPRQALKNIVSQKATGSKKQNRLAQAAGMVGGALGGLVGGVAKGTGALVGGVGTGVGAGVGGLSRGVGTGVGMVGGGIGDAISYGAQGAGGILPGQLGRGVAAVGGAVGGTIGGASRGVGDTIGGVGTAAGGMVGGASRGVGQAVGGVGGGVGSMLAGDMQGVRQGMNQTVGGLQNTVGAGVGGVRDTVGAGVGGVAGTGQNMYGAVSNNLMPGQQAPSGQQQAITNGPGGYPPQQQGGYPQQQPSGYPPQQPGGYPQQSLYKFPGAPAGMPPMGGMPGYPGGMPPMGGMPGYPGGMPLGYPPMPSPGGMMPGMPGMGMPPMGGGMPPMVMPYRHH